MIWAQSLIETGFPEAFDDTPHSNLGQRTSTTIGDSSTGFKTSADGEPSLHPHETQIDLAIQNSTRLCLF